MILGYKTPPGEDDYYFAKIEGQDKKYRRVLAGIVLPVFDRQNGAVVVIAELYRAIAPVDFTALAATVGPWPIVERSLKEYDKHLQFRDAIMESEEMRRMLWQVAGLSTMVLTAVAPKYAFTDIGRQKVDQLIREGRMHLDLVESTMRSDPDVSGRALQAAVCYALEFPSIYKKKTEAPEYGKILGTTGL